MHPPSPIFRTLAGALCLAATLQFASPPELLAQPIYNDGHADIGVGYDAGEFEMHYHFDTNATYEPPHIGGASGFIGADYGDSEFAPTGAYVRVPTLSQFARPASDATWSFTGASAGESIFHIPSTATLGVPRLGFGTEELDPSDWGSNIRISLTDVVSSPAGGEVSLWSGSASTVGSVQWSSSDGVSSSDFFEMLAGGHGHFNFGFTQPGVYELEITAAGDHLTDGPITGSGIYTFLVGDGTLAPDDVTPVPEPSSLLLMLLVSGVLALGWKFTHRRVARNCSR